MQGLKEAPRNSENLFRQNLDNFLLKLSEENAKSLIRKLSMLICSKKDVKNKHMKFSYLTCTKGKQSSI